MDQISCDHCGKVILQDDIGNMYSIKVNSMVCSIEVSHGLLHDALHYCCDKCMFDRGKGLVDPMNFDE